MKVVDERRMLLNGQGQDNGSSGLSNIHIKAKAALDHLLVFRMEAMAAKLPIDEIDSLTGKKNEDSTLPDDDHGTLDTPTPRRSRTNFLRKTSSLLSGSFTGGIIRDKKNLKFATPSAETTENYTNHSSHPSNIHQGTPSSPQVLYPNSYHNPSLTTVIERNSGNRALSATEVAQMLQSDNIGSIIPNPPSHERESTGSSSINQLPKPPYRFGSLSSSSSSLTDISRKSMEAGLREFSGDGMEDESDLSIIDSEPETESSDPTTMVMVESMTILEGEDVGDNNPTSSPNLMDSMTLLESLGENPSSHDLDSVTALRVKEYLTTEVTEADRELWDSIPQFRKMDLTVGRHLGKGTFSDVFEVTAVVFEEKKDRLTFEKDRDDLDRLIEAKFPSGKRVEPDNSDDMDRAIEAMFGGSTSTPFSRLSKCGERSSDERMSNDDSGEEKREIKPITYRPQRNYVKQLHSSINEASSVYVGGSHPDPPPTKNVQQVKTNRPSIASSVNIVHLKHPQAYQKSKERRLVLAMKRLRPYVRSGREQFMIGVEDLIHETVMLASLAHPNIIKIHGRAGGKSDRITDGIFILLDRLMETLHDRMIRWKNLRQGGKNDTLSLARIKVACSIADALSYLHSKMIIFRDLKPMNIGFDSTGTVKLFDFGFALSVAPLLPETTKPRTLYDICGTPRYMSPENGLNMGYSLPADVYSFGILLWEIWSLKKPFRNIKSTEEFEKVVFLKGLRPKLSPRWPADLLAIMGNCWSESAKDRPDMHHVASSVLDIAEQFAKEEHMKPQGNEGKRMRKSFRLNIPRRGSIF